MITADTKAEARNGKEGARKVLILNLALQLQKHPVKNHIAMPRNQMIGIPAELMVPLV